MNRELARNALPWVGGLVLALAGLGSQGCLERRDDDTTAARGPCTSCHGSSKRDGSDLERAAPPVDLGGGSESKRRGVGAHQNHLGESATHAKIACNECHVVPDAIDTPGHADNALPAELSFGTLAQTGGRSPEYDGENTTCTNTYCHRAAEVNWTSPRTSEQACGTCHGLPPPLPHPPVDTCNRCHASVIDKDRNFIAPELHVNGTIDVKVDCVTCHGSPSSNAPPPDLAGNTDRTSIGVGAHQPHLAGGQNSRPLACNECHTVPQKIEDPGHIDQTPNAEVTFSAVALTKGVSPVWDRNNRTCASTWCHGPSNPQNSVTPEWTTTAAPLGCTACHGTPPASPHPQISDCSLCHSDVINDDDKTIKTRALHVDGKVDVKVPSACNTCHGNETNPAPPKDLSGKTATTVRGVGAHQTHLSPVFARPVPCSECHSVPLIPVTAGHMDTPPPAELTFSGVAILFGAAPALDPATERCNNTYCHGASFYSGKLSGGTNTAPKWTNVGGEEAICGSCHAIPPPSHTLSQICSDCHKNMKGTLGIEFIDPKLHVNGIIEPPP